MIAVSDIFDALGGPATVARELRIKPSTASEMKRRSSIPAEYWTELVAIAQRHRHPEIDTELLAALHSRQGRIDLPPTVDGTDTIDTPPAVSSDAGHFGRLKHRRRTRFATAAEINDHVRALRDEWDRR